MSSADAASLRMPAEFLAGPGRNRTRYGERPLYAEGLYRVAPDAYAWMVPNGSWGETNIGLIDCKGKSVLVDTCWDLRFTQEVLDTAGELLRRSPIDCLINTHADGDHCWGNQLLAGTPIIATAACAAQMRHLNPRAMTALHGGGRLLGHVPLAGIDRFGRYMRGMFHPYDFKPVTITGPTQSFSGRTELTVNGVDILVCEVGPAHTDGDAYVYLPQRKLLYGGDILFVGVTPVMWAGPLENLVAALRQVLALDAQVIVPGHGPLATRADVQNLIDYWDFLHERLHRCLQRAMPPYEAAREVALGPDFQSRPFARWDSPERIVTNAYTLYRHWGAHPGPSGQLGMMDLFRRQALLAYALPQATPRVMRGLPPAVP